MSNSPILIDAVKAGDVDQVKDMLEAQPNLLEEAKGTSGESLLLLSVYHHKPDITQILLAKKADLSIHEAAATGNLDQVKQLLQTDQTAVNAIAADGFTPLGLACFFNYPEVAKLLIGQGADVNAISQNSLQVSPLHSAVAARNPELVALLLDQGADIDARQAGGFTALHAAAAQGDEDLIKLLLERRADINATTADGQTPMELAIKAGHEAGKWFSL